MLGDLGIGKVAAAPAGAACLLQRRLWHGGALI